MIGRKSYFLLLEDKFLFVLFAGRLLQLPSGTMGNDISLPVTIASRLDQPGSALRAEKACESPSPSYDSVPLK